MSLVASRSVPGLLCKEPVVLGGDGSEAGTRGDSTTSCGSRDCVCGASPMGQMCGVAQYLGSSPLKRMSEVGLAGNREWLAARRHNGVC